MKRILFLCTGNSCRSILAEGALNLHGGEKFKAYSAGSFPKGYIHPWSIKTLTSLGINTDDFRSKSWDEFINEEIDIIVTVCDNAAGEVCPIFPGAAVKTHWGITDPALFAGSDEERDEEFLRIFSVLERRVKSLIKLPFDDLSKEELQARLDEIGEII